LGTLIFGYKLSSAAVSAQRVGYPIDVAVFPISCQNQAKGPGAIAMCMYAWDPQSSKWVPYVAAA